MKTLLSRLPIILSASILCLPGCASYSQTFIGPGGDFKQCASTSQSQGLGGVFLASSRYSRCVEDVKTHGYKELETVGAIGITLYAADAQGLEIMKVYDNSPAAKAGIVRGDRVVSINGKKVMQKGDFDVVNGEIGSPITINVIRNGKESTHALVRAKLFYSRALEDVTY